MGRSLEEILGGAKEAQDTATASVQEATSQASQELQALQARIFAGEDSTDSPLHDGVIALYGNRLLDPEILGRYEQVSEQLKAASLGDPIVAIRRWIDHSGCSGFGGRLNYFLKTSMAVGILDGQQMIFDHSKKTAYLPTAKYIFDDSRQYGADHAVELGGLEVDSPTSYMSVMYGFRLGEMLGEQVKSLTGEEVELSAFEVRPVLQMEILAGRDAIRQWLNVSDNMTSRDVSFREMRRMCTELGIDPIEPANEWQKALLERKL